MKESLGHPWMLIKVWLFRTHLHLRLSRPLLSLDEPCHCPPAIDFPLCVPAVYGRPLIFSKFFAITNIRADKLIYNLNDVWQSLLREAFSSSVLRPYLLELQQKIISAGKSLIQDNGIKLGRFPDIRAALLIPKTSILCAFKINIPVCL